MFASDATKDYTVEQRVTAKAVVIMDASRKLARSAQTRPGLAIRIDDAVAQVDLEATPAIVNYGVMKDT